MLLSPQTWGFLTCVCWRGLSAGDRPSAESRVRPVSLRLTLRLTNAKDHWAPPGCSSLVLRPVRVPWAGHWGDGRVHLICSLNLRVPVTCCLLSTVLKTDRIFSCFRKKVNLVSTNSSSWKQTKSASLEIKKNPWASVTHFYNFRTERTLK